MLSVSKNMEQLDCKVWLLEMLNNLATLENVSEFLKKLNIYLPGTQLSYFWTFTLEKWKRMNTRPIHECFSSLQFSRSVVSDSLQPHESQHARPLCPSPTPGVCSLTSIKSVMPSSHLILCCPLLFLTSIFPSIRVFSNESTLRMRWPKYWSCSFSIIPSKEHPGLISFRMHWLDLPAVKGTLKSFLQHHSSKASILRHSAFFTVQLSHPYMTTGKTIALTDRPLLAK